MTAWAVDAARQPAGCLLIFDRDRRLVGFGAPGIPRPDVAKVYGKSANRAGFKLVASGLASRRVSRPPEIRVFALAGGTASELPGPAAPG